MVVSVELRSRSMADGDKSGRSEGVLGVGVEMVEWG